MPGNISAGDVRHGSTKRVATGVGEGSIARPVGTSIFDKSVKKGLC